MYKSKTIFRITLYFQTNIKFSPYVSMTLSVGIRSRLFKKLDTMFVLIHTMLLKEQGRLLSDWLICYPSAQTLFKRTAENLKNKDDVRRSDFMLTLHYCLLKSFRKMLEAFLSFSEWQEIVG